MRRCGRRAKRWLLGEIPTEGENDARKLSTLPMRLGGLGLRSAERCAPAAFWASWADALPMIAKRNPEVASEVVHKLSQEEEPLEECLLELHTASSTLDRQGFYWRPSWVDQHDGKRPLQWSVREPGEWPHCWQYWASSI